jgi:uncharacterized protein (DUF1330 family)
MNASARICIALLAGAAIGATAVEVVRAQAKPPAYYVSQIELTGDADTYVKNYASQVPATVEPFGGRFLVRGGKVTRLEGDTPRPRIVVIAFDNIDKAQAWYNSPAYQKLAPVRQSVAKTNSFFVEGPTN